MNQMQERKINALVYQINLLNINIKEISQNSSLTAEKKENLISEKHKEIKKIDEIIYSL
jgi:hypothetical protein